MSDIKLCKDCAHFESAFPFPPTLHKCKAILNPVDGSAADFCEFQRAERYKSFKACGPDGKLFVQRKSVWMRFMEAIKK